LDVKTKDGQELYKLQKQTAMIKLLIGRKVGFDIYYYGADDVRITAGLIHVNNGGDHCIEKNEETKIDTAITGWHYVTVNNLGNIAMRAATGTSSQRPTDVCFQWSGYNHSKHGYYFSKAERIIGAVYRVSATSWYIISCGEGGNETGNNSLGSWERVGNVQTARGRLNVTCAIDQATGSIYISPVINPAWPATFKTGESPQASYCHSSDALPLWILSYGKPTATGHNGIFLARAITSSSSTRQIDFIAIGKWR
jgi:hypothetical protein